MKKVLILAYDFPPYISVGGLRPYNWFKYLHEFGVYPIVITRQWNNKYGNKLDYIAPSDSTATLVEESIKGTIIRSPYFPNFANRLMLKYGDSKYKFLRKGVSGYYETVQFLFLVGTKSELYFSAKEYLKKNKVDVIIATGDPFVLFQYASKLSKAFNIPWIADYRDPWTQKNTIQKKIIFKNLHSYFEKKIVNTSYSITTVNGICQSIISSLIKNKEFSILANGYDPEVLDSIKGIKQRSEMLTIAFVGTIYNWHPIRSFLSVISNFIKGKKEAKLKVNFYGINRTSELSEMWLNEFPDLLNHVVIYPKMYNKELLQELAKENIMLLFNDYSFVGTKVYDYICIKRTILLCYANDEEANKLRARFYPYEEFEENSNHAQEDLIRETNSGYVIQDANHLLEMLGKLYDEFTEKGFIQCNTINSEKYSRKHQVKQLAEIIKNISSPKK